MAILTDIESGAGGSNDRSSVTKKQIGSGAMTTIDHSTARFLREEKLARMDAPQFPALPDKTYRPSPHKIISHSIGNVHWRAGVVTPKTTLRTAWAILVSWYIDSPEVLFGVAVDRRHTSLNKLNDIRGTVAISVPFGVHVSGTIDQLLHQVQQQAIELASLEKYPYQLIEQASGDGKTAYNFQSLLSISTSSTAADTESNKHENSAPNCVCALRLECQINRTEVDIKLRFDPAVTEIASARRLLHQLEHILNQLNTVPGDTDVGHLSRISDQELRELWHQNACVPETVQDCVHNVFSQRVAETPEAIAVCAWDGEMTYSQLDRTSTLLARHLISSGLGLAPGTVVPLYFEKSKWVPVAILAVMKAGAASVAVDSTLPQSRVKSIVGQLSSNVMLSSRTCAKLAGEVTDATIIQVDEGLDSLEPLQPASHLPEVSPSSALYIVFTSGSTGVPKGATVSHANFCSAIRHQQQQLGFERSSRVYDYTSYSFDVAWSNVLHTLTAGGCLCIPSEYDRTADISGSINRLKANFVHLTPTLGRFLDPATLGGLTKILFIGEALKASDVVRWKASSAEIFNTYGPAECTVTSTIYKIRSHDKAEHEDGVSDPSIGEGVGVLPWIVQPANPKQLSAVGTIGELWLEGPIVGTGYLNNPEKTAQAFIEDPEWLLRGVPGQIPGRHGRLYKTGDLAFYSPDGSIGFIGRKDTQVKFNGQRMELGEVEHHVRHLLSAEVVTQIVADVITPIATRSQTLAAFLVMSPGYDKDMLSPIIANLRKELSERLPSFMVPSAYIPLEKLPMTATGKTDRKAILELGKIYDPFTTSSSVSCGSGTTALSETEEKLRTAWANVLDIKADNITPNHNFIELGGNSIKMMSLAMAINKNFSVKIGVQQLVEQQRSLRELSSMIDSLKQGKLIDEPAPVDLEREVDLLASEIQCDHASSTSTVFLTGATGFLGTQILRHTLAKRAFDRVIVLVRPVHEQQGIDRVRKAAQTAGWWQESYASAIDVWAGDLSAENLGLTDSRWSALCGRSSTDGTIDAIIHNGAIVHWSTPYTDLKAVNVGSTVKLLRVAMDSPFVKSFVYVSGGLITDSRVWTKEEERMANGYDQSKYVSERLVSAAAAKSGKSGTKFSVIKPGQIIGDVYTGAANADDFLWRVVMSAIRLGARPVESENSWLSVSDVRHVAETIIWHATGKSNDDFVHIKRGLWVNSFWTTLEEQLQQKLRQVSWDKWTELVKHDMVHEKELHPLWPVQQYLGALGTESTRSYMCEWEVQEVVAATRQNIEYLRRKGLTSNKPNHAKLLDAMVPTRTRDLRSTIRV